MRDGGHRSDDERDAGPSRDAALEDVSALDDGGQDVARPGDAGELDGGVAADAGHGDGGSALDGGLDAGSLDGGATELDAGEEVSDDSGVDAGFDAGVGAGLDAGIDAGIDAGPPPASCAGVLARNPAATTGSYDISPDGNARIPAYCEMDLFDGGWTRVIDLDVARGDPCPGEWIADGGPGVCSRHDDTVSTATFPVPVAVYDEVLARARGRQFGTTDSFGNVGIDEIYVDGLSLTAGVAGQRQHVATFAVGLTSTAGLEPQNMCPCAGTDVAPAFVTTYLCDTAGVDYPDRVWLPGLLWDDDASDEMCALAPAPRWQHRSLPEPTSAPIEARLMCDQPRTNEDVGVGKLEIYVR